MAAISLLAILLDLHCLSERRLHIPDGMSICVGSNKVEDWSKPSFFWNIWFGGTLCTEERIASVHITAFVFHE